MMEQGPQRDAAKGKSRSSKAAAVATSNTNMVRAKAAAKTGNSTGTMESTRNERAAAKNTAKSSKVSLLLRK